MFFKGSRYAKVEESEITVPSGRSISYKKVRFIPRTKGQRRHIVSQGERLDHISFRYYRDPERFWQIADANLAMWPDDLLAEAGRTLKIPVSED